MLDKAQRGLRSFALYTYRLVRRPLARVGLDFKRRYEFAYWQQQQRKEGQLRHSWYRNYYTVLFDLDPSFYDGKRILDIGCGPRGSLEWADNAARRVGLDPLVDDYRALGIDDHEMEYVGTPAEEMPFDDASFDVVTSINSLDHVNDVGQTLAQITRVLAPGGTLLIAVDVHPRPTIAEPHTIPWDLSSTISDDFEVVEEFHFEKTPGDSYGRDRPPYDHDDPKPRYGTFMLNARRRGEPSPE
jgi:SAM-dependent methyltransferase